MSFNLIVVTVESHVVVNSIFTEMFKWFRSTLRISAKTSVDMVTPSQLEGPSSAKDTARRIYATSQITHNYRAVPAWISTEDNWLADALSRPNSPKCWQKFEDFANSLGARPIQRQISPEMYNFY